MEGGKGVTLERQCRAILERLQETLKAEGLHLEMVALEGRTVLLRGRRLGAGPPTAFLMRAVQGTFRHYLPAIEGVHLVEYTGGSPAPSTDTRRNSSLPPPQAIPRLDLSGLNRRDAARALEAFMAMQERRGADRVKVLGLAEEAPRRAAAKWAAFREEAYRSRHADGEDRSTWVFHLREGCRDAACCSGEEEDALPGHLLLPS